MDKNGFDEEELHHAYATTQEIYHEKVSKAHTFEILQKYFRL